MFNNDESIISNQTNRGGRKVAQRANTEITIENTAAKSSQKAINLNG